MQSHAEAWGQHLILDFAGCPKERLTDGAHIKVWVKDLIEKIEMVAYGEPMLEHFATHDPKTGGYTLVQLIETSNICAHFAENRGEVYIGIFSCKSFDAALAQKVCEDYFQPQDVTAHNITRGEPRMKLAA